MIESAITCTLALQSLRAGVYTGSTLDKIAHDWFGDGGRRGRSDEDFTAAIISAVEGRKRQLDGDRMALNERLADAKWDATVRKAAPFMPGGEVFEAHRKIDACLAALTAAEGCMDSDSHTLDTLMGALHVALRGEGQAPDERLTDLARRAYAAASAGAAVSATRDALESRCEPASRTTGLANAFDLGWFSWMPSRSPGAWVKVGPVGSTSIAWAWGESGRVVRTEGDVTAEDRLALEKAWSL